MDNYKLVTFSVNGFDQTIYIRGTDAQELDLILAEMKKVFSSL
ncbi:MAG: hypothetical protein ABIL11_17395 [Chloroflexota bacterium]